MSPAVTNYDAVLFRRVFPSSFPHPPSSSFCPPFFVRRLSFQNASRIPQGINKNIFFRLCFCGCGVNQHVSLLKLNSDFFDAVIRFSLKSFLILLKLYALYASNNFVLKIDLSKRVS